MKNINNTFKQDIRTYGRQLDFKIKINNIGVDTDNFSYIRPTINALLFKTIMHAVKFDTKYNLNKKDKINIEAGIKVNEPNYKYVGYNSYYVYSSEREEDTLSYTVMAYDKMLESMIDYDLEIAEKITLREYLIRICERLGWDTSNIPASFINSSKLIDPTLHIGIGYTFRDVLDEIATLSCSALVFINDVLCLKYPEETNQTIDESYLSEDSITIGEKVFFNSLVFSRAEESDNIFRKDDDDIEANGLHEYRISDNQLLSTNDRDLYIDEMWEYLQTFEFYTFDIKTKGILFLEAYDRFSLSLGGQTYSTILLNDEIAFDDGLTEDIYMDAPEETQTDYKCASETDKKINKAYILVDKQNQKIESLTSEVGQYSERISTVEQTVNGISQKVESIEEFAREISSKTQLHLTDTAEGENLVLNLTIYGDTKKFKVLTPAEDLVPSEDLVPYGDTIDLIVDTQPRSNPSENAKTFEIAIGEPLRNIGQVRDELNIINNKVSIIRRIKEVYAKSTDIFERRRVNSNGTLSTPQDNYLLSDYIKVESLKKYDSSFDYNENDRFNFYQATYYDENKNYLGQESITGANTTFTTIQNTQYIRVGLRYLEEWAVDGIPNNFQLIEHGRTKGELYVLDQEIIEELEEIKIPTYKDNTYIYIREYPTLEYFCRYIIDNDYLEMFATQQELQDATVQLNTKITQTNSEIEFLASEKVGKKEVIAKINLTPEKAKILAKLIELEGYVSINGGFKIDEQGNMEAVNGKFTGGTIDLFSSDINEPLFGVSENKDYTGHYTLIYPKGININGSNGYMVLVNDNTQILISDSTEENQSRIYPDRIRTTGNIYAGGTIYATEFVPPSKVELKENIQRFNIKALNLINNSDIYSYNYKTDKESKNIGLVIGKGYNTPNEVISKNEGINLYAMNSLSWKAIQELDQKIEKIINMLKKIPILGRIITKRWNDEKYIQDNIRNNRDRNDSDNRSSGN